MQPGICDGARARREHPAGVRIGIEGEMERGELGHSRERVSERAIEWTEDVSGGVDGYAKGAHDTGEAWFVGESHDSGQVVVRGGEVEVAVEDALRDGTEERAGAREGSEVGRT